MNPDPRLQQLLARRAEAEDLLQHCLAKTLAASEPLRKKLQAFCGDSADGACLDCDCEP
jgi:hypothetical protein